MIAPAARPAPDPTASALAGRTHELGILREVWGAALAGRGNLMRIGELAQVTQA
jgi:hypothetical protein